MKNTKIISALTLILFLLSGCNQAARETANLTDTTTTGEPAAITTVLTAEAELTTTEEISTAAETTVEITSTASEITEATEVITAAATEAQTTEDTPLPTFDKNFFNNDLFIGDSIFTGLYLFGFLDQNNVFAEIGLNPESLHTKDINGITCPDKITAMQPRHIYIMLGTNGLAYMNGDYMANKLGEFTDKIKNISPKTKVFIISIPPVTKEHEALGNETMAKVNYYNSRLKATAESVGCTYIDLCSSLLDDEGYFSAKYAERDGLHFLGAAYYVLLNAVQVAAK